MLSQQLRKLYFIFSRYQDPLGTALTSVSIKKTKSVDRDLVRFKNALISKEPVRSQSLYDEFHHRDVYKRIDTDLQAFFYKRQYNVQNFNFLINLLGHQHKMTLIPQVLAKMQLLKVIPDQKSYTYIIKAAAIQGDIKQTQQYFNQACEKFGQSKYFYTALMQVYLTNKNPQMGYKIVQQMIEKGIQPDLPVYTTLINSFRIARKLPKCWQLNKQILKSKVELDETYVGVMLKVHAATHDAEKAIKLFHQQIISKKIKPMLQTMNSYFKALSTRPQYAQRVIDEFFQMTETGVIINQETVRWALKASASIAGVKSAIQIVKIMKHKNLEATAQIYNSLIRVYANACDIPNITTQFREVMLMDTWKIIEQVINKNMLDTTLVNNAMLVYANSMQQDKIEGLILPLFDKFNLEMNPITYQILVDLNYKKKDFTTAVKIYQKMKIHLEEKKKKQIQKVGFYQTNLDLMREDLRPTFNLLQTYIQMGIRLMNMHMILEALDMFKKLKRHPKNSTLKFLGTLKNLPIEIQVSLMDFQIQFGAAKLAKTKASKERSIKDPQDK